MPALLEALKESGRSSEYKDYQKRMIAAEEKITKKPEKAKS
jgi:hypothetical protein